MASEGHKTIWGKASEFCNAYIWVGGRGQLNQVFLLGKKGKMVAAPQSKWNWKEKSELEGM